MSSYIRIKEGIKKLRTQEDSPGGIVGCGARKNGWPCGRQRQRKISAVQNIVRLRKTG